MKIKVALLSLCLVISFIGFTQKNNFKSIHQEESEYYQNKKIPKSTKRIDNINLQKDSSFVLSRRVFGYHPYWAGNDHVNYQWDLLSDLCYFSYKVDPATGNPATIHEWETSPAVDSALAKEVKVHLCVTLFAGHYTFFQNQEAQTNLIENLISLVQSRGAHGINMDVEALPSSLGTEFTNFIIDLSNQMDENLPDAELSIASPAVNWSGTFDIPVLKDYIDFFMVMGYDYYWSGSSQAGPVSPLYSMTLNYDYNFSKTISYYQSQGVPVDQLLMGVPYYGRQWPTSGQYAPSASLGSATAYTYRYVKLNSTIYSGENKHWESNSFSPYYSFDNNGWKQCFIEDTYSLGKKYDLVNRRNLAGIGIWALGYDNGFADLWELIATKFTLNALPVLADTIYDTGGPSFNYYNNENYTYTIETSEGSSIYLSFSYLDLEDSYDSLWIYDGSDTLNTIIGIFTGNNIPTLITSSSNSITLKFKSDNGITDNGWRAVYDTIPVSNIPESYALFDVKVYPNPATNELNLEFPNSYLNEDINIQILDQRGSKINSFDIQKNQKNINIDISRYSIGSYLIIARIKDKVLITEKFIIK